MNQLFQEMNNKNVSNMFNNPQLQSVIKLVKDSGKSPKDLFYQKANEMGVDPNTILQKLR